MDSSETSSSSVEAQSHETSLGTMSTSSAGGLINVAEMLRETESATTERNNELITLDSHHLLVTNTQEFEPNSLSRGLLEETLETRATAAIQHLFNDLFARPAERVPNGAVVSLPKSRTKFPREKPLPEKKPETRWETFARIKGIKKTKKSKWDWDEAKQEWRPRHGFRKANDTMDDWVVEDNAGRSLADPSYDPFAEMEHDKKDRVRKQGEREAANLARAASKKQGVAKRVGATISLDAPPLAFSRRARVDDLQRTANAAQQSTASLGIFDKKLDTLGERKIRGKRKRFEPVVATRAADEKERNLKIMRRVVQPDTDDAAVDIDKAVKQQRRRDHQTGQRTGEAAHAVRDTQRRSKQGRLRQRAKK